MARSRNIKPAFFLNDELADLPPIVRLLALGLPCIADREGRIKDRHRRIKAELLPYDEIDVNDALSMLNDAGFIQRYTNDNKQYIQIVTFPTHQNPHCKEQPSTIPAPDLHSSNPADSLNLIPDSLHITSNGFDDWWGEYPKKVEKKKALAIWNRRKLDLLADQLITDVINRKEHDAKWRAGYIPNPTTYLNGDRWEDEISDVTITARGPHDVDDSELIAWATERGLSSPRTGEDWGSYRQRLCSEMKRQAA